MDQKDKQKEFQKSFPSTTRAACPVLFSERFALTVGNAAHLERALGGAVLHLVPVDDADRGHDGELRARQRERLVRRTRGHTCDEHGTRRRLLAAQFQNNAENNAFFKKWESLL